MIEILKSKDKQWYFVVKAKNGRILVTSETYKTRRGALRGVYSACKIFDTALAGVDKSEDGRYRVFGLRGY